MSRRHPLLAELENALDTYAWDEAERLLRAAQNLGLTHSKYGIPLRYILTDLPNQRTAAADKDAAGIMATASALAAAGHYEQARQHYRQVAATPAISLTLKEQITAAIATLNDAIDYGAPQDPAIEHQLEAMMVQLITEIKEQQPTLATLMATCAIPLWWDEKLLAAIRNRQDGREPSILEKLSRFSFVYAWPEHYTYSRLARRMLLQSWEGDPSGFQKQNQQILDYLQEQLTINPISQPVAYARLVQAHLYHTFLADPATGVVRLGTLMQQAEDGYRLEDARQYVWVLKELQPRLPAEYSAWIDYAEGWLHHLNQRDAIAQQIFQQLRARPDLPPNLRARVERGIALALVVRQNWVEAVLHHRTALSLFQEQQQSSDVAETMVGLGDAYLSIAQTADGQIDEFELDDSFGSVFSTLVGFIARLPLILFLVWKLHLTWDIRVWWKLGRGMDWVVAHLFSEAILWFRRAEALYQKLDNQLGLQRAQACLGRLYLTLNHPGAVAIFRQLAASAPHDTYQQARAFLELAEALLRQRKFNEAEFLLQQALPVFTRLNHARRIAQTQSRLGDIAAHQKEWDRAMHAYATAWQAWQQVGNAIKTTDVIHAMEALDRTTELPATARDALAQTQQQTTKRVYEARFVHPVMAGFQHFASVLLWVAIFIALLTSIRSEAGTNLGTDAILKRPTEAESVAAFKPTVGATNQEVVLSEIKKQVTPRLRSRFLGVTVAAGLAAYLSLYTVLGLYLLVTTTMGNVQAQQGCRLVLDSETIDEVENNRLVQQLHWTDVRTYVTNHRLIFGKLAEIVSSITLLAPDNHINISAHVRHYWVLTQHNLLRLLPTQVLQINTGYALPYGLFGWLLMTVLTLLTTLIILIVIKSPLLDTPLPFLSYTPMELHGLLFVAGALPMLYWFVIQPVRDYLIRQPQRKIVRGVALASLLLGLGSLLQFRSWHLPIGRPDLLFGALTILLAGFALHQHFLLAQRRNHLRFYFNGSLLIVILAIGFASWAMQQELRSFRALAQANSHFLRAEETLDKKSEAIAKDEYLRALTFYTETLSLRAEPYVYNSQGNVYIRLKEYAKAIRAYQDARQRNPEDRSIHLNLALAYREWASDTQDFALREERYLQAVAEYNHIIAELEKISNLNEEEKTNQWSAHELRAATWHELGKMYYDRDQKGQSILDYFSHAHQDYEWLIAANSTDPAGYVGKGWSLFYLRLEHPLAEQRQDFEKAITAFSTAITKDPNYSPAYNGLGWMHWYIGNESIPGDCIAGINAAFKADYQQQIEAAVAAFSHGVEADSGNGFFFRTRAQLYYILGYCEPATKIEYLRKAVADYDLAVKNAPTPGWHWRQGTIYQELATDLDKAGRSAEARAAREAAIQSNLNELKQDPNYSRSPNALHSIYAKLGYTAAQAFETIVATMRESTGVPNFTQLARNELNRGEWTLAIKAAAMTLADKGDDAEAYLIQAQAFWRLSNLDQTKAILDKVAKLPVDGPAIAYELGLTHLMLGNTDQARATYRAGNQATSALPTQDTRQPIYAKAIKDLLIVPAVPVTLTTPLVFSIVDTTIQELKIITPTANNYFDAGQAALDDRRYALAVPLLVQAIRLEPSVFRYWTPLRNVLIDGYGANQTDSGAAVLTVILGASTHANAYATLLDVVHSELERDTFGLAVAALDRVLVLRPDSLDILLLKAQIYQRWGEKYPAVANTLPRYQLALENAQQALKLKPDSAEAFLILGRVQRQLGFITESLDAYKQAVDLGADDEAAGWVAYVSGDYAEAVTAWAEAITHNAAEPRYYFNQGLAFIALGDADAAQQSYENGIAAADSLEAPVQRDIHLYEALADLTSIQVDPRDLAGQFMDRLANER